MSHEHSPARASEHVASVNHGAAPPPPTVGGPPTPDAVQSEIWARLIERAINGDTNPQTVLQQVLAYSTGGYWYEGINEYDAAEFLGVEHRSLQKWRQTGGGPIYAVYSSRCLRYRRINLKAWRDSRMRTSTSDPAPRQRPHDPLTYVAPAS